MMKQTQKFDERFERGTPNLQLLIRRNHLTNQSSNVDSVVEENYTTPITVLRGRVMAFVRRKGNNFFLVHNVRRGGKVRQLHLARLGMSARISDEVVRQVSKKHPFIEVNWNSLREQLNSRVDLADPDSPVVQKLVSNLRSLNLDLADVFPPLFRISGSPAMARELLLQLRLLQSTLQVKLDQFDRGGVRFGNAPSLLRGARRRS
jgi:hypothetical protein